MTDDIVVCMTSRGNYARIGPVLHVIDDRESFNLHIINAGASMIRKYGSLSSMLRERLGDNERDVQRFRRRESSSLGENHGAEYDGVRKHLEQH